MATITAKTRPITAAKTLASGGSTIVRDQATVLQAGWISWAGDHSLELNNVPIAEGVDVFDLFDLSNSTGTLKVRTIGCYSSTSRRIIPDISVDLVGGG